MVLGTKEADKASRLPGWFWMTGLDCLRIDMQRAVRQLQCVRVVAGGGGGIEQRIKKRREFS